MIAVHSENPDNKQVRTEINNKTAAAAQPVKFRISKLF